jgi:acyl carrier protein
MTQSTEATFESALRRNLPQLAGMEQITDETPLRDVGLDSLGMVNLLLDLEETFSVLFDDADLDQSAFETIGSLRRLVDSAVVSEDVT